MGNDELRKAYRWTYEQLRQGRSRRSVLLRSRSLGGSGSRAVKDAFKLLDKLSRFDLTSVSEGTTVFGIDEVGRGPLAGPLVACCVRLPYPAVPVLPFLRDSKKLSAEEREDLAGELEGLATSVSYGVVEAHEFGGKLNLHHLTFLAMTRALSSLPPNESGSYLLVDGKFCIPDQPFAQKAVIKGDDTSLSIAAASVLAKVKRDKMMHELHSRYPQYGFHSHVGYGTQAHRAAILKHGPCPQHRVNFIARILNGEHTGSTLEKSEGARHDP